MKTVDCKELFQHTQVRIALSTEGPAPSEPYIVLRESVGSLHSRPSVTGPLIRDETVSRTEMYNDNILQIIYFELISKPIFC